MVTAIVLTASFGVLGGCGDGGVAVPQIPDEVVDQAAGAGETADDSNAPAAESGDSAASGIDANWPKEIWLPTGLTAMSQVVRHVDGKTAASLTGMVMTSRDDLHQQVIDVLGEPDVEESAGAVTRLQYNEVLPDHSVNYVLEGEPDGSRTTLIVAAN